MKVAILGAGGHAKVVADALLAGSQCTLVGFFDDNPSLHAQSLLGFPVFGPLRRWSDYQLDAVVIGIGDNQARHEIFKQVKSANAKLINVLHPRAVLGRNVRLGEGVVLFGNVVVNADTCIGDNVVLNTACTVDHDCTIGSHSHIAPGANICGEVRIGEGVLVGVGTNIIPGISIGSWSTIGAGAVVTNNVPPGSKMAGIPARAI
jgi:sugar O-acyltransferase (sialic acid O-acetyltransferase NeuD family)